MTLAGFSPLVKAAAVGLLMAELWYFSQAISIDLYRYIETNTSHLVALIACGLSLSCVAVYLYVRNGYADFLKLISSYRADILVMMGLGVCVSVSFDGLGSSQYKQFASLLKPGHVLVLLLL